MYIDDINILSLSTDAEERMFSDKDRNQTITSFSGIVAVNAAEAN